MASILNIIGFISQKNQLPQKTSTAYLMHCECFLREQFNKCGKYPRGRISRYGLRKYCPHLPTSGAPPYSPAAHSIPYTILCRVSCDVI